MVPRWARSAGETLRLSHAPGARWPSLAESRLERHRLELDPHAALERGREREVRPRPVVEPGERLEPDGRSGGEVDDRLEDGPECGRRDRRRDPPPLVPPIPASDKGGRQDRLGHRGELTNGRQILDEMAPMILVGRGEPDQTDELAVRPDGRERPALDPERPEALVPGVRFRRSDPALRPGAVF